MEWGKVNRHDEIKNQNHEHEIHKPSHKNQKNLELTQKRFALDERCIIFEEFTSSQEFV